MAPPISVMLVDDHPMWRQMLRKVLEHRNFAAVVAEACHGAEAVELARIHNPDLVVMDIQLSGMNGIDATRALIADRPELKVLVLASSDVRSQVISAVHAGASGYLLKTSSSSEVADAVRKIHGGELVFPASVAEVVLSELRRTPGDPSDANGDVPAVPPDANVFRKDGDYWTVTYRGETFLLKDTRGARFLCQLIRNPGREIYALDLVVADRGGRGLPGSDRGDDILDAQARASLKQKLEELADDVREAEAWDDTERVALAREQIDVLTEELARSVGLGGRGRKAASPAERARINVTLAIKATLRKVSAHCSSLGQHLDATVRTGIFCSYEPDPRVPISWTT